MTLALTEPNVRWDATGVTVMATPLRDDYVMDGKKLFVRDAHVADYVICAARTKVGPNPEDGITLFLVDSKTAGVQAEVLKTMTGEKQCEVLFSNVLVPRENILGELHNGWPIVKQVLLEATAAECCWMISGARWALEDSIQYAKERIQFGRPIGSFQAIQHKCANMAMKVEGATSITYYAAWAVAENAPDAELAVALAKAYCSDGYKDVTAEGIQIHGGIGFTWDHDMHLYFKRAKSSELIYGDATYHRDLVANMLNM